MTENTLFQELARITYWFFTLLSFEIIFSVFYRIEDSQVRSRSTGRFTGTRRAIVFFLLIGLILYFSDRFLSDPIISILATLQNSIFPLCVFAVSFDGFYFARYILRRGWTFSDVLATLGISVLAIAIAIFMISNGNKLL